MRRKSKLVFMIISIVFLLACDSGLISSAPAKTTNIINISRDTTIPPNAIKMSPQNDAHPPILLSNEFENPIPVPGRVNTAGGEDSPFITPDGNTLYFFFTPDVTIPAEKQITDKVTGIYVSKKVNGEWDEPKRVFLQGPGKLAMDGCEFVLNEVMWFCSAREGYTGIHWFTAEYIDGRWTKWKIADFNPSFKVGELYITKDGKQMYFGSDRPGGKGKLDIWVSTKVNNEWQEPINVASVNTNDDEGWPQVSSDGRELWFYRNYSIWRSEMVNGEWQKAEQIISSLAGEPSVDNEGNLYFVHHYYIDDKMIEADIYVAYKKK